MEQELEKTDGREAAALYAFCGWLTCRDETIKMGITCEVGNIPDLIVEFLKSQGWSVDPPEGWDKNLRPYPSARTFRLSESAQAEVDRVEQELFHSFPVISKGPDGELVRTQFVPDGNPYGGKQPEEDDGA